jgi:hypothetical protein
MSLPTSSQLKIGDLVALKENFGDAQTAKIYRSGKLAVIISICGGPKDWMSTYKIQFPEGDTLHVWQDIVKIVS